MKLYTICMTLLLVLASAAAGAVDLSDEEGAALRERAQALLAERERNPSWDGGTRYSNDLQSEAQPDRSRTHDTAKAKPKPKPKREPVRTRIKRAAKKLPGALLRDR